MTEARDSLDTINDAFRLIQKATLNMRLLGLKDRGGDLSLKHELRMMAMDFSAAMDEPPEGQHSTFHTGNGKSRTVMNELKDVAAEITRLRAENERLREAFASQLYETKTANHSSIHCNRFNTWDELSDKTKEPYRQKAALKGQS